MTIKFIHTAMADRRKRDYQCLVITTKYNNKMPGSRWLEIFHSPRLI